MVENAPQNILNGHNHTINGQLLTQKWSNIFHDGNVSSEEFEQLYCATIDTILSHKWHTVSSYIKRDLKTVISLFENCPGFIVQVDRLQGIVLNPWHNNAMSQILSGQAKQEEAAALFDREGSFMWFCRVKKLLEEEKSDEGWMLLQTFMFDILGGQLNRNIDDDSNTLCDMFWCQAELRSDKRLQSLLQNLSLRSKEDTIRRLVQKNVEDICWCSAKEAVITIMYSIAETITKDENSFPNDYQKLIKDAIVFQNVTGDELLHRIRKLVPFPAPKTYNSFIKALFWLRQEKDKSFVWRKRIDKALLEFLLRDITKLMNEVEEMTAQDMSPADIRYKEKFLSQRFNMLRILFGGKVTKRELSLTVFSLDPSVSSFEKLVEPYARELYGSAVVANCSIKADANPTRNVSHSAVYTAPDAIFTENPDLDEDVLTDLVTVIGNNRDSTLLWDLPWPELCARCKKCIEKHKQKHVKVPLTNLERDYSAGITIIPDEDFYEPGYWEDGEPVETPRKRKKEEEKYEKSVKPGRPKKKTKSESDPEREETYTPSVASPSNCVAPVSHHSYHHMPVYSSAQKFPTLYRTYFAQTVRNSTVQRPSYAASSFHSSQSRATPTSGYMFTSSSSNSYNSSVLSHSLPAPSISFALAPEATLPSLRTNNWNGT